MAFYGKRRKAPGPSKNELKQQRNEAEERRQRNAAHLGDRFPQVQTLTISLQFLSPQNALLGEEKRVFKGNDALDFSAPCPGRCGSATFNLDAKVASVVDAHQDRSEGGGMCQDPLYAGSPDVCGTKLQCKIEVTYQD